MTELILLNAGMIALAIIFWYYGQQRKTPTNTMETIVEPKADKSIPLFDTHRYFKTLRDAGVPEVQADGMTEALVTALNQAFAEAIRRGQLSRGSQ